MMEKPNGIALLIAKKAAGSNSSSSTDEEPSKADEAIQDIIRAVKSGDADTLGAALEAWHYAAHESMDSED